MSHAHRNILVALAGQPNCGKSAIFNLLTGARQHVANFPGVTVEKKEGAYRDGASKIEVIDLPGTYSLTSYSQEERVTRDFLLLERPEVVVAVVDASNLERHCYLFFQMREMRVPLVLCLNMIDVAERRGMTIDVSALSEALGVPVVVTNGKTGRGGDQLRAAIRDMARRHEHLPAVLPVHYGEALEKELATLTERLESYPHLMEDFPPRWLAVKLFENDAEARRIIQHHTHEAGGDEELEYVEHRRHVLREEHGLVPEKVIAISRYRAASALVNRCVQRPASPGRTHTDKIDSVLLHRLGGPLCLMVVLFLFYQIAMRLGMWASGQVFPYLHRVKEVAQGLWATPDPLRAGLFESLMVDGLLGGLVAILYYVPMFLVLFSLMAVLEDSGYMARVAFLLDRLLRWFGLHGQSTLPMILGGVVVGGCAVPGIMATRAMKDQKARLVTILIMPLMNCLAKMPFYALIVGLMIAPTAGFRMGGRLILGYQGLALFLLSVFSFVVALLVAKFFHWSIAHGEHAPFVMELPVYHMPTFRGVFRSAIERVWLFLRKIITIVAVVQVVTWFFVTFPGIGTEREVAYDRAHRAAQEEVLLHAHDAGPYTEVLAREHLPDLLALHERVRTIQRRASDNTGRAQKKLLALQQEHPVSLVVVHAGRDAKGHPIPEAAGTTRAFRLYQREVARLRRERSQELIHRSWAGRAGRALESVSRLAGFGWQMNIAIIASFAAKESLVGTLGTLYSAETGAAGDLAASVRRTETGWTIWHKLSILIFVALFPPCLATIMVVKNETASWKWALFVSIYPIVLGFVLAVLVFQTGMYLWPGGA